MKKDLVKAVKSAHDGFITDAEADCPTLSGELVASINGEIINSGLTAIITATGGSSRNYAAYVNYGTINTPANPFMLMNYDKHLNRLHEDAKRAVRRWL